VHFVAEENQQPKTVGQLDKIGGGPDPAPETQKGE